VEIRGLGVLNLEMLFGVTAVRERKRIDIVIRLVEWEDGATYERLGVDDQFHTLLGVALRELRIPVRPGRDMAAIAEIAARQELLRRAGHTPAHDFVARIEGSHQPDFAHVQALLQRPYESMMPPRAHDSSERPVPPEEGERGEGERGDAERGDPTR
jgi:HPr kinase/phosphorylase